MIPILVLGLLCGIPQIIKEKNTISKECIEVEVTVTGKYYKPPFCIYTGNSYVSSSSKYEITVEYMGEEYTFDDYEIYKKYKEGETAIGIYEIREYENGTKSYEIVDLKQIKGDVENTRNI